MRGEHLCQKRGSTGNSPPIPTQAPQTFSTKRFFQFLNPHWAKNSVGLLRSKGFLLRWPRWPREAGQLVGRPGA